MHFEGDDGWSTFYFPPLVVAFVVAICSCAGAWGWGARGGFSSGPAHNCRFRATLTKTYTFAVRTHVNTPRIGWHRSMWLRVIAVV